jgi:hypothetical protein
MPAKVRQRQGKHIPNHHPPERLPWSILPFPESIEELSDQYKRLRPLMPDLHARIGKLATKESVKACAKRLGMLTRQGGKMGIHFDHEAEMDVFQDYLLYMHRPRGISLVRQMLNRKPYPQGSDEQILLEGMAQARFSLFWVRELHPAGGFTALDVITGEEVFIFDHALPEQDTVGLLVGLRLFPLYTGWMHTGASMVLGQIDEASGMQPLRCVLNEKEERDLNEENIRRWRANLKKVE